MCRAKSSFQNRTLTVQFEMVKKGTLSVHFLLIYPTLIVHYISQAVNLREKGSLGNFLFQRKTEKNILVSCNYQTIETFLNKREVKTFLFINYFEFVVKFDPCIAISQKHTLTVHFGMLKNPTLKRGT